MRDIEFLPSWYSQTRRRQQVLRLQAVLTMLLVFGLICWLFLSHRNLNSAQAALTTVDSQLAQSQLELDQLQTQLRLKSQLEMQRQIVSRLGVPVEMSRLLRTLDTLMPKQMSLVESSFDTQEVVRGAANASSGTSPARTRAADKDQPRERRLLVRLVAVAPSDVDLANFLAGLTSTPFFQDVALTFSRDKTESGHMLREFEVTFSMNLNSTASNERGKGSSER